jgi:hypothetical protein
MAFPRARLVCGDRGQDQGINVVLASGFDEYFSVSARHFFIEQIRIYRTKCAYAIV